MPDQFVVLLLGPARSGKTTFLKSLIKKVPDGRTTACHAYDVQDKGLGPTSFLIIDTPGFNSVPRENLAVLKKIAEKVAEYTQDKGWRVSSVIYFHRITDIRLTGPTRDIIKISKKICGEGFCPNIAVVTTMWNRIAKEEGPNHLRLHNSFGEKFPELTRPDTFFRLDPSDPNIPAKVLKRLVSVHAQSSKVPLQLETEVRSRGAGATSVRKTEAGKEIEQGMEKIRCTIL